MVIFTAACPSPQKTCHQLRLLCHHGQRKQTGKAQPLLILTELEHLNLTLFQLGWKHKLIAQTPHPDPWPIHADLPEAPDKNDTGVRT